MEACSGLCLVAIVPLVTWAVPYLSLLVGPLVGIAVAVVIGIGAVGAEASCRRACLAIAMASTMSQLLLWPALRPFGLLSTPCGWPLRQCGRLLRPVGVHVFSVVAWFWCSCDRLCVRVCCVWFVTLVCDPSCFKAAHVCDGFVMFVIGRIVRKCAWLPWPRRCWPSCCALEPMTVVWRPVDLVLRPR